MNSLWETVYGNSNFLLKQKGQMESQICERGEGSALWETVYGNPNFLLKQKWQKESLYKDKYKFVKERRIGKILVKLQ